MNVKFGTKVAFSTRMMHTLTFLEKFNCGKICKKKPAKDRPKRTNYSSHASPEAQISITH